MPITNVSDTARWVAVYRAMESERPDAIFHDPYARRLAGQRGEEIVRTIPDGVAMANPMIVRTKVLDEIILQAVERDRADAVLNLACGLDARPYRMPLPPTLRWVEVDLPEMIAYKREQLAGEQPRCRLESVAADLSDAAARRALFGRVAAESSRVLVVSEGLLIYLAEEQVGELARDLAAPASFRWWAFDIASPFLMAMMQKRVGQAVAAGNAPFRFAPAAGPAFFDRFGWRSREVRYYWDESVRLHREYPAPWWARLLAHLMPASRKEQYRRMNMFVLLERA